jgi:acetyltransferase
MRSCYLSDYDIDEMINSTKIGKIIRGVRGESPIDMNNLKSSIKSLAQMMLDYPEITECDLNPLLVSEDNRMFAVDVRIKL